VLFRSSCEAIADLRESAIRVTHCERRSQTIILEEVRLSMRGLKNGKSRGIDGISAELLKAAGEKGVDIMHYHLEDGGRSIGLRQLIDRHLQVK